jgi:hypothetical protein
MTKRNPASLALKKQAEDALAAALAARSEAKVRKTIDDINVKIRAANRTHISGPPATLVPYEASTSFAIGAISAGAWDLAEVWDGEPT